MKRKPYATMTDQELNDATARKIMGWRLKQDGELPGGYAAWWCNSHGRLVRPWVKWWPLTNADQLADVLDRLLRQGWRVLSLWRERITQYEVTVFTHDDDAAGVVRTDTRPRALLVAALEAIAAKRAAKRKVKP